MNGMEMVLSYLIAIGIGGLAGYFLTNAHHRRDGDGKTVKEWRAEYGDYKQSVNEHFQRSAELFQGLTEQYRQVYSHLAEGAVTLCRDSSDDPRIEALRTGLLTGAVATTTATAAEAAQFDEQAEAVVAASNVDAGDQASVAASSETGEGAAPATVDDSAEAPAADPGAELQSAEEAALELEVPAFTSLASEDDAAAIADNADGEPQDVDADGQGSDTAAEPTRTAA